MKNKNLGLKLCLLAFAISGFSLSFGSAVNFNLNVEGIKALSKDAIKENMMNIHFADNGNDFGGFFYFSNGSGENVEGNYEVGTSDESNFICGKKIRGFYYNAERGERLWPLDDETWQKIPGITGLVTTGGIYTLCGRPEYVEALRKCEDGKYKESNDNDYDECVEKVKIDFPSDGFGYYGQLNQTYSGQEFKLTVGVEYDTTKNFISIKSGSYLKPTFVRINNKYPVGFVYDYNGGVGLAGCRFTEVNNDSMKKLVNAAGGNLLNVFTPTNTGIKYNGNLNLPITCTGVISTEDTLVKILVEGIVGLDNHGIGTKFGGLGNSSDAKMQYFGTKTASNVALMNYAAKKAESLCRGKWRNNFPNNIGMEGKIICLSGQSVNENQAINVRGSGKTLVVKNGDVTIKPDDIGYYDIFIDSGNLIIDESDAEKYVIGTDGFVYGGLSSSFSETAFNLVAYVKAGRTYQDVLNCFDKDDDSSKDLACTSFDWDNNGEFDAVDFDAVKSIEAAGYETLPISSMASVIKGNFIVNGKVKAYDVNDTPDEDGNLNTKLKNKYFIYGKFTTKSSISELENVFSWRCNNGFGTDNIFCPKFEGNFYQNAALVVIDQNYGSPLFGS